VILDMALAANTTLATLRDASWCGFLDFRRERATAARFVQKLGIKTPSLETPVKNLSGGNQQKVALARWLAANPLLLILDEPTQGVDVGAKAEIHRLMNQLALAGLAILMISSDMAEVLGRRPDRRDARRHHAGVWTGLALRNRSWSWRLGHGAEAGAL
jgi:rhamnose transport system ATP-binding protein